jgi:diguanylate cyclase (GGDEF)-like protein
MTAPDLLPLETSRLRPVLLGAGLGVIYAALAVSMSFVTAFGEAASFWPGAGVTLAALLLSRPRSWPYLLAGVWVAEVAVDLGFGFDLALAAAWGTANVAGPLCAALLLGRVLRRRIDLADHRDLLLFVGCAVLVGPAVSALIGAGTISVAGMGPFALSWARWLVGDGIGVLVVAPAVLALRDGAAFSRLLRTQFIALGALAGILALTFGPVAVLQQSTTVFFIVPVLVWLAFREAQVGAAVGVLLVALVGNTATAAGWGPFAAANGAVEGLIHAQAFLGTMTFSAFMVAVLTHDLVRRDESEARFNYQATHDMLTGLANRRLVFDRLGQAVSPAGESKPISLLMIDLDGFKQVNDTFGHAYGDAVLVEMARRISLATRSDDLVARLGGDEFLVYLGQPVAPEEVHALADRLTRELEEPVVFDGREVTIGASVGTSIGSGTDVESLLRGADEAMYAAKRSRT